MSGSTAEERTLSARQAAYSRWAKTTDRTAATAPARAARDQKFLDAVPAEITDPVLRARAAELLRKAHFQRLSLKAAQARRRKAAR